VVVRIHLLQQIIKILNHLITSGCSFTSAHRVNYERSDRDFMKDGELNWYYPHWIQRNFPSLKVYNMGSPGNNNALIARSAIYKAKQLLNKGVSANEINIIIQWSSFFRRSHFISNEIESSIPFEEHKEYVNDYINEKQFPGSNGYWLNLAIPDLRKSTIETENEKVFNYNQSYLQTLYNDESRYFEWLEYFDYIIHFCESNGIKLKCFFMHNSFSTKYDYDLMPMFYNDGDSVVEGLFNRRIIFKTWGETNSRIDMYPYARYLYNSIDWDKYCWFFEEEGLHSNGGIFEWAIRNQVKSTSKKFNPLFMEFEQYKSQSKLEEALRKGEMGCAGHISSCNHKKFTEEVILKWDMFKQI
jgi:hypothetical protein